MPLFLSSPFRSSAVSVVFDFNDSLNDPAPPTSTPLSAGMGKSYLFMYVFGVCIGLHDSGKVQ